jgi:hypothetical protein
LKRPTILRITKTCTKKFLEHGHLINPPRRASREISDLIKSDFPALKRWAKLGRPAGAGLLRERFPGYPIKRPSRSFFADQVTLVTPLTS